MNRRLSRKDQRKNERVAKKQRNAMHHQKMVSIRKGDSNKKVIIQKTSNTPPQQSARNNPKASFKSSQNFEIEDDEEILSDSDAYAENSESELEEPKIKIKKNKNVSKKKKIKQDRSEDEDDFLDMIDSAFESGKLTKDGLMNKKGKIDKGKFTTNDHDDDQEDEYDDNSDDDNDNDNDNDNENFDLETYKDLSENEEIPLPLEPVGKDSKNINSKLRKLPESSSPSVTPSSENVKLVRQVQSLVNKLGSSNLIPICNDFEGIFRNNRRKEVIEILTETMIGSIVRPGGNLLDTFALNFAALSFIIHHMVGIEFGAHLIEKLIETIDSLYIQSKSENQAKSDDPNVHERSLVNCMNFCSFIYDLQMISSNLICDLIRQSSQRLDEIDVEIILKLFKTCGQQIKRDDADFMKIISSEISKNSLQLPKEKQSSRFKFMIETINDLKDSKRKLANAMTVELEPVKKMIKNFLSQKMIAKIEPLRISLEDIRNIESKGKWWLVGSSWHPQNSSSSSILDLNNPIPNENDELAKIEKLAKAQRMNTELRKSIFSTIISSDDYSDAFERLLAMKLSGKQEREIILVIIHCCGQEKVFNPFYALLAGKFASHRQGFKITLQYTLWDCLKQIKDYPLRKLANIAKLYGFLLSQGDLPLSILRKGNFIRLSNEEIIYWQLLFMTFFTRISSDDDISNISQALINSIETGKSVNPSNSIGKSKIVSLTENVDMTEFDDDFFAAQDKITNSRGMSVEKLEECKNLRNGLIYFLDLYFLKTDDFPFSVGIEICKKRARRMKQVLSN